MIITQPLKQNSNINGNIKSQNVTIEGWLQARHINTT